DALRPEILCRLSQNTRIFQGRGVYRYLVSAGGKQKLDVRNRTNSAADGEGNIDPGRDRSDKPGQRLPLFVGRCYIQKNKLVRALSAVGFGELNGIAGVPEI